MIMVQAASADEMETATGEITSLLRQRHKLQEADPDDFTISSLTAITKVASDTTQAMSLLLGAIASISLIVGAIGIMNIMLVTVTERTREIGIRKAIGATESQILQQFLLEAIIICGIGSFSGLVIGGLCGIAAERWFFLAVQYSIWSVVLSLGVAVGIGVISGIYPAYKAARLHPIEALRSAAA
jgi:putative ABC transport system permease protein